ncbi:MAG: LOG family protein [Myxococcota bacterium]
MTMVREVPLPEQKFKPREEDPLAPERIKAIIDNPSYIEADHDLDFLHAPVTRGIRLQLDYLKAEYLMQEKNIKNTVVVFGGTRIKEAGAVQIELDKIADDPSKDVERQMLLRLMDKSKYYSIAHQFGNIVARANEAAPLDNLTVMTGGGPGVMEAANRGAHDANARSIGLNIRLPLEQFPNPYITPGLCFYFHYFAMRKLHFLERAKALVAFPGGYGTLDELFEVLTLIQTRKVEPMPVVLVGEAYWRQAVNFDFLLEEGVIAPEDRKLFWFAESAEDIWQGICKWYAAAKIR